MLLYLLQLWHQHVPLLCACAGPAAHCPEVQPSLLMALLAMAAAGTAEGCRCAAQQPAAAHLHSLLLLLLLLLVMALHCSRCWLTCPT
jgi:hypothetical protein